MDTAILLNSDVAQVRPSKGAPGRSPAVYQSNGHSRECSTSLSLLASSRAKVVSRMAPLSYKQLCDARVRFGVPKAVPVSGTEVISYRISNTSTYKYYMLRKKYLGTCSLNNCTESRKISEIPIALSDVFLSEDPVSSLRQYNHTRSINSQRPVTFKEVDECALRYFSVGHDDNVPLLSGPQLYLYLKKFSFQHKLTKKQIKNLKHKKKNKNLQKNIRAEKKRDVRKTYHRGPKTYTNDIEDVGYRYMEFQANKKRFGNYRSKRVHPNKLRVVGTESGRPQKDRIPFRRVDVDTYVPFDITDDEVKHIIMGDDEEVYFSYSDDFEDESANIFSEFSAWFTSTFIGDDLVPSELSVAIQDFKRALSNIDSEFVDLLLNTFSFLYLCWKSKDVLSRIAAVKLYVQTLGFDSSTALKAIKWARSLLKEYKPVSRVETESFSQDVSKWTEFLTLSLSSPFVSSFRSMLVQITSYRVFSLETSKKIYSFLGKPRKMSVIELFNFSLKAITSFLRVAENIHAGVPITEVLFNVDPVGAVIAESKILLNYQNALYSGLPVPYMMDRMEFMAKADEYVKTMGIFLKKTRTGDPRYLDLHDTFTKLTKALRAVYMSIAGGTRRVPFAWMLTGPPGIGKSFLSPYIFSIWSRVKGRKFDPRQIFVKNDEQDYFDGINPFSQPYLYYQEVGRKSRVMAERVGDTMLDQINKIVDSNPYMANMAFEDKGTMYLFPEVVGADSNNYKANVDRLMSCPEAFLRRFIFIVPRVKREFLKDTVKIDPIKSLQSDSPFMDKWTFTVFVEKSTGDGQTAPSELLTNADIYEFTAFMEDMMEDHINTQDAILSQGIRHDTFHEYGTRFVDPVVEEPLPQIVVQSESRRVRPLNFCFKFFGVILGLNILFSMCTEYLPTTKILAAFAAIKSFFHYLFNYSWVRKVTASFYYCLTTLTALMFLAPLDFIICRLIRMGGYSLLSRNMMTAWVETAYRRAKVNMKHRGRTLMYHLGWDDDYNPMYGSWWQDNRWAAELLVASVGIVVGVLILKYKTRKGKIKKKKPPPVMEPPLASESHTRFVNPSQFDDAINDFEENYHCGNSYERIPVAGTKVWNVMHTYSKAVHTGDPRSLSTCIYKNVRRVLVKRAEGIDTYILGICEDYAVINMHSIGSLKEDLHIGVSRTGSINNPTDMDWVWLEPTSVFPLCGDAVLIRLSSIRFKDIRKHINVDRVFHGSFMAHIGSDDCRAVFKEVPILLDDEDGMVKLHSYWEYPWSRHTKGLCGLPLIVQTSSGSVVVGIHCAGAKNDDASFATPLFREELNSAMDFLSRATTLMPITSECLPVNPDSLYPTIHSPFRHEVFHGIRYYGREEGRVEINRKSSVRNTPFKQRVKKLFKNSLGFESCKDYVAPMMKPSRIKGEYVSPFNVALRNLNKDRPPLKRSVLSYIVGVLTDRVVSSLRERHVPDLSPLTIEAAINGVAEDPFTRRINASTSAGHTFPGTKEHWMPIVREEDDKVVREFLPVIRSRILDSYVHYDLGQSYGMTWDMFLKDEPRPLLKALKGHTRPVCNGDLDDVCKCRQALSPFYTHMVEYGDMLGSCVGINMHTGADALYKEITDFSNHVFEGDYKTFDYGIIFDVAHAASSVVYNTLARMGYNEHAVKLVVGLLSDTLFPRLVVNRDVLIVPGIQPSGRYATAEDNCLRNLIMVMYSWYTLPDTSPHNFFDNVRIWTYGDDILASVKPKFKDCFNGVIYADFCLHHYNMEFTTPQKGKDMSEFVPFDEMTFLKRKFVYKERWKRYVAPLELDSILRSLTLYIPSKNVPEDKQMMDTFSSSLRELFFHLDEEDYGVVYDELSAILVDTYGFDPLEIRINLPTFLRLEEELEFSV